MDPIGSVPFHVEGMDETHEGTLEEVHGGGGRAEGHDHVFEAEHREDPVTEPVLAVSEGAVVIHKGVTPTGKTSYPKGKAVSAPITKPGGGAKVKIVARPPPSRQKLAAKALKKVIGTSGKILTCFLLFFNSCFFLFCLLCSQLLMFGCFSCVCWFLPFQLLPQKRK